MVDFDRLNAMVNEVNKVISDVESETIKYKKEKDRIEKETFDVMWDDICDYLDLFKKCVCKNEWMIVFQIENYKIKFYWRSGNLAFGSQATLYIIDGYNKYNYPLNYYSDNHYKHVKSCNTLEMFMQIANEWESKYKELFEIEITKQVESILKERAENAHAEYDKAKADLEN